jgi:hypothetical protein
MGELSVFKDFDAWFIERFRPNTDGHFFIVLFMLIIEDFRTLIWPFALFNGILLC